MTINNDDGESAKDNKEMALLITRFRKFIDTKEKVVKVIRVKKELSKREKEDASKRDLITYYKCKKSNHIRTDYPLLKKKKRKKKASHKTMNLLN